MEHPAQLLTRMELCQGMLAGQTAIVTGAANGLGKVTACQLAWLGANVVIVDCSAVGHDVAEDINHSGGQARFIQLDLAKVRNIDKMLDFAHSKYGAIHILVNNAAIASAGSLLALSREKWDRDHAINLRAPFFTIKAVLPEMLRNQRGVIVNVIAVEGLAFAATYCSSKYGVRSLTQSLAGEVGNKAGVFTFSFKPGVLNTPLMDQWIPQLAPYYKMTPEQLTNYAASGNIGYQGVMPVEHCAASLVHSILHAKEYHGQEVGTFDALIRYGIISKKTLAEGSSSPTSSPQVAVEVQEDFKKGQVAGYYDEVVKQNRDLEIRIAARTEEIKALVNEIHHRVKNNLQFLISMIEIQSVYLRDPKDLKVLEEFQGRIAAMGLVHEQLSASANLSNIAMNVFIPHLVDLILKIYVTETLFIQSHVVVDPIVMSIDQALSCGLILHELLSNAIKYAFPDEQPGTVTIHLRPIGEGFIQLLIKDNGIGMPPHISINTPRSMGLHLVALMIRQLEGELKSFSEGGTQFQITFKAKRK